MRVADFLTKLNTVCGEPFFHLRGHPWIRNCVEKTVKKSASTCLQLTGGVDRDEAVQRPSLDGEVRHVARDSLAQYRAVRHVAGERRHTLGHACLTSATQPERSTNGFV